jgi:hypothetical protein
VTAGEYPRERVAEILTRVALPASIRIVPRRYLADPLGVAPGDSRFCARADGFRVLYAAPDFATAFVEVIVRDRFARRRQRAILLKEVTERAWVSVATRPRATLTLLDLRKDGCVRLGAPTDAVSARNHAAGRALGRAIHAAHGDVDGLLFSSRLTGGDVYAIFDRALGKLDAAETGLLADHPDLPAVLSAHGIGLVVT